jgi:glutamate dehydrogenase
VDDGELGTATGRTIGTAPRPGPVAFVLGGGGLLGASEIGMLRALFEAGRRPDLVVGTSVGALNGALVAADPTPASLDRLAALWRSMSTNEVFSVLDSDLPDDPYLLEDLQHYFPSRMKPDHLPAIEAHPLRRQIIVTQVVNDLVNGAGMTFWPRLQGETGASAAELTRANFVAREIFGSLELRDELRALDNKIPAERQTRMRIEMRTLVERASRWLVTNRRPPLDSTGTVDHFRAPVQAVMAQLPQIMSGRELEALEGRCQRLTSKGIPEDLAVRVGVLSPAYALLGIVDTATDTGLDPADVARVHFTLGERLGLPLLVERIFALPRDDRWQTMARASLRDDLYGVHQQLTARVLAATPDDGTAAERVAGWEDDDTDLVTRATTTLEEICGDESADLARLSVGLRVVRSLLT